MTVTSVWAGQTRYAVSGVGYAAPGSLLAGGPEGQPAKVEPGSDLERLPRIAALCNESSLEIDAAGQVRLSGDPTEAALLVLASKAGLDPAALRERHPVIGLIPFESERGWMATLHAAPDGGGLLLFKGAPERFAAM